MRIDFDLPGTCEIVIVSLFLNNLLGDDYHQPSSPVQSSPVRPRLAIISFPSVLSGPDISCCAGLCLSRRTSHTSPLSIVRYPMSRHISLDPLSAPPSLPINRIHVHLIGRERGRKLTISSSEQCLNISSVRPFNSIHNKVIMKPCSCMPSRPSELNSETSR